jgi:hypothetical protein
VRSPAEVTGQFDGLPAEVVPLDVTDLSSVSDTDFMAIDARARYARDPVRYERGMAKLLDVTDLKTAAVDRARPS